MMRLPIIITLWFSSFCYPAEIDYDCSHPGELDNGVQFGFCCYNYFSLRYECNEGFQLIGNSTIVCLNGTWSGEKPYCLDSRCKDRGELRHGHVSGHCCLSGDIVTYSCKETYRLIGSSESECQNGTWSDRKPHCRKVSCDDPGKSWNGDREGPCCWPGDTLTYTCNEGYQLDGPKSITCLKRMRWTKRRPLCKPPVYCPRPLAIANGRIEHDSKGDYFEPYSVAQVICDRGYVPRNGSDFLYCQENGNWDSVFAQCSAISCERPEAFEEVIVEGLEMNNRTRFPYGFELLYSCDLGFRLIGSKRRTCESTGWSGTNPFCEEIRCYDPGVPDNGWRKGDSFHVGMKVVYGCSTGFTLLGAQERVCLPNGQWSGYLTRCNADYNHCPEPGTPINGMKDGQRYKQGDIINFKCKPGFVLTGSSYRECQANKTWSGVEAQCRGSHDFDDKKNLGIRLISLIQDTITDQNKAIDEVTGDLYWEKHGRFAGLPGLPQGGGEFRGPLRTVSRWDFWNEAINDHHPGRIILYFLFDSSGSVSKDDFNSSIRFAQTLINKMNIEKLGSRVGAVVFSSKAQIAFMPSNYSTTSAILEALNNITYKAGGTDLTSAFRLVKNEMMPQTSSDFPGEKLKNVIFLITDGKPNMGGSPVEEAQELKNLGVEIYCIGVTGNPSGSLLYKIASPGSYYVYFAKNYKALNWLVDYISKGDIDYSECGLGLEYIPPVEKAMVPSNPRSIGGDKALEVWPWMASIHIRAYRYDYKGQLICGGSMINERWILTAAHCLFRNGQPVDSNSLLVKTGWLKKNDKDTFERNLIVNKVFLHPDYDNSTYEYDAALLYTWKFPANRIVRPICLPSMESGVYKEDILYKEGENAYAIGWGYNMRLMPGQSHRLARPVNHLKQIRLPLQSPDTCQKSLEGSTAVFTETMFCAGTASGDIDTCKGDSGGPMMQSVLKVDGTIVWVQIGIISWGNGCGVPGQYSFHTRVDVIAPWINNITSIEY